MDIALHIGQEFAYFKSVVIVVLFASVLLDYVHIDIQPLLLRLKSIGS